MRKDTKHSFRIGMMLLLLAVSTCAIHAQQAAGTTVDRATRVYAPTTLTVQSGSNYIRIDADHLPATVTYVADTAFGPVPTAMVMEDTLDAQMLFFNCQMAWRWELTEAENAKIMEIKAHENASILVNPYVCQVTTSDTTATACGSYEWRGQLYDESGDYSDTLTNVAGCDSIRTLHLTVYHPQNTDTTATVWDSIMWYGQKYTISGEYPITKTDEHECTYTHTLHLTVHTTTHETYSDTGCDSIKYNGKKFIESGVYADTVYDADGNRTITALNFTVNHSTAGEEAQTACGTYMWHNQPYSQSGDYIFHLTNAAGCDSTATLHLTIQQPTAGDETQHACDSYEWHGQTYTESGDYMFHTTNVAGCDSTATLHLTIHPSYHITLPDTTVCMGLFTEGYWFVDTLITTSGVYTRSMKTVRWGCDSVLTQNVKIAEETWVNDVVTAYDSCTWINGNTYYQSGGGHVETLTSVSGCDSIVSLILTIRHLAVNDTLRETVCLAAGESYRWKGKNFAESGTYSTDTLPGKEVNKVYMDSLYTLVLTVNRTYAADTAVTVCGDEYTWRGKTYTQSGDYLYEGKTKANCDSIVTLHLTITQDCGTIDTVYFCMGQNTVHDERVNEGLIRRYLVYEYESPAEWDYMEGAILVREKERMQVDLRRAEENLYAHYVNELTPVSNIRWSYRADGESDYRTLEVNDEPQWVETGTIAVTVQFVCGQFYTSDFEADVVTVNGEEQTGRKVLENGQIIIIRGGVKYNVLGFKILDF